VVRPVSVLRASDARLHYLDGSHRWTAPSDAEQARWEAMVRAHVEEHRRGHDGAASMRNTRLQGR
jgi:hypothetical protein